jgi:hypothetical protein
MSSLEPGGVGREDGDWLCRAGGRSALPQALEAVPPTPAECGSDEHTGRGPATATGTSRLQQTWAPGVRHADAGLETSVWPSDPIETGD